MSEQVIELAYRAVTLGEAVGFTFADVDQEHPGESEHLNADGVWEYHFETAPQWGFLAAGSVDEPIETTFGECSVPVTVDPYHWFVFKDEMLVSVFTPTDGSVVGSGVLEDTLLRALQYEIDAQTADTGGDEQ